MVDTAEMGVRTHPEAQMHGSSSPLLLHLKPYAFLKHSIFSFLLPSPSQFPLPSQSMGPHSSIAQIWKTGIIHHEFIFSTSTGNKLSTLAAFISWIFVEYVPYSFLLSILSSPVQIASCLQLCLSQIPLTLFQSDLMKTWVWGITTGPLVPCKMTLGTLSRAHTRTHGLTSAISFPPILCPVLYYLEISNFSEFPKHLIVPHSWPCPCCSYGPYGSWFFQIWRIRAY